ncbi:MAG: sulfatase [Acidobacteriota bacterium]
MEPQQTTTTPRHPIDRRQFIAQAGAVAPLALSFPLDGGPTAPENRPNLVFVFADQMRAQASSRAGDPNVQTPNLDRLAGESVQFAAAVSNCPVCCPYRASLMTGQYPLTHGIFLNDLHLSDDSVTIGKVFSGAGYETAYIGKWHLNGRGRSAYIPPENRQGFKYWRALECTHEYNNSFYYADDPTRQTWKGYDAIAQTSEAETFLRKRERSKPFALFLSWGPPHNPYNTAPPEYRARFNPEHMRLRPNVPEWKTWVRQALAGYYAHIVALDDCLGQLVETLRREGLEENTILVFTSDHGDMLGSQDQTLKQRPWDESILVPFLLRFPKRFGRGRRKVEAILSTPDIMPTLLGLCQIAIPGSVEGKDLLQAAGGAQKNDALIASYAPFHDWGKKKGGREFRGVRTLTHTYVRDLQGPWLLYNNVEDPYQKVNRCQDPDFARIRRSLDEILRQKLADTHDEFLPSEEYVQRFGYVTNDSGEVPYEK